MCQETFADSRRIRTGALAPFEAFLISVAEINHGQAFGHPVGPVGGTCGCGCSNLGPQVNIRLDRWSKAIVFFLQEKDRDIQLEMPLDSWYPNPQANNRLMTEADAYRIFSTYSFFG